MTDTDRELVARLRDWPRDPAEAATWVGAQAQMRKAADRIEALASDRDAWKARAEAAEQRLAEMGRWLADEAATHRATAAQSTDAADQQAQLAIAIRLDSVRALLQHKATP